MWTDRPIINLVETMAKSAHDSWWETYRALGYTSRKAAWGEEQFAYECEKGKQGK
jgi:hypothetical protein